MTRKYQNQKTKGKDKTEFKTSDGIVRKQMDLELSKYLALGFIQ